MLGNLLGAKLRVDSPEKFGLLIAGTKRKLHDHLCLSMGPMDANAVDCEDIRQTVISYIKTRQLTLHVHKPKHEDAMDIGAIAKGKDKGKKGGKHGKFPTEGKGKEGTGTFNESQNPKAEGQGKDKPGKGYDGQHSGAEIATPIPTTYKHAGVGTRNQKEKEQV